MNDGVLIRKCKESTITIDSKKVTKIIIEECENTTINIECIILSSTFEVINCDSCNIQFKSPEGEPSFITLQIDNSKKTDLKFIPNSKNELSSITIISDNRCQKNSITIPNFENEKEFMIHDILIEDLDYVQHRSKISKKTNSVITGKNSKKSFISVPISREGSGFIFSSHPPS
jgi:hypothetical protein